MFLINKARRNRKNIIIFFEKHFLSKLKKAISNNRSEKEAMRLILTLVLIHSIINGCQFARNSFHLNSQWEIYKKTYNKIYVNEEPMR